MTNQRPSWDEYFMEVTRTVAKRATCDRGKSGCIIVKDKRILCTGYVGSPVGIEHCDEIGHEIVEMIGEDGKASQHCVRTSHAEQNALAQAAKFGISIDGGTVYCKMEPCYTCAKMLINSGIKRVVAEMRYHAAQRSRDILVKAGVELVVMNDETEKYDKQ
jgi:dCMP deaminase